MNLTDTPASRTAVRLPFSSVFAMGEMTRVKRMLMRNVLIIICGKHAAKYAFVPFQI